MVSVLIEAEYGEGGGMGSIPPVFMIMQVLRERVTMVKMYYRQ